MLRTIIRTAAATAALSLVVAAPAAAQFGAPAPYVGSISGSQIVTGGDYSSEGASLSWNIEAEGELLRYTYTFAGLTTPGISHFILSLSDGCVPESEPVLTAAVVVNPCISGVGGLELDTDWTLAPGNPGFPEGYSIYGAKIDTDASGSNGLVFTFLSSRIPIYGNFYAKGGRDSYAYNTGLTDPEGAFIARPDTENFNVIPEPSTYALMGTGMLGLLGVAARRRRQG